MPDNLLPDDALIGFLNQRLIVKCTRLLVAPVLLSYLGADISKASARRSCLQHDSRTIVQIRHHLLGLSSTLPTVTQNAPIQSGGQREPQSLPETSSVYASLILLSGASEPYDSSVRLSGKTHHIIAISIGWNNGNPCLRYDPLLFKNPLHHGLCIIKEFAASNRRQNREDIGKSSCHSHD